MTNNVIIGVDMTTDDFETGNKKVISGLDQLGKKGEESGEKASKGFGKAKLSLTDLKSGIDLGKQALSTFTGVFEKAFEIGKEGGAIIQTEKSFDGLIDKLGLSEDLLTQLQNASAGTIDNLKLMSATNTLLAGTSGDLAVQLGNSTPQLLEIAKAANKLNPSLGDTAFLYESIATGVKRASPMILDNLGLTIKIGEANETYAKSLGKTVDQLTADEQKQALLNATLKAGKVLIAQAGGAAGSATDSFARLETSVKNTEDALKKKFSPALADAADALNIILTGNDRVSAALKQHQKDVIAMARPYQEYSDELDRAARAAGYVVDAQGRLITKRGQLVDANYKLTESEYDLALAAKDTAQKFADNLAELEKSPQRFDDYSEAGARAISVTHDLTEEEKKLIETTQKLNEDALEKLKINISGEVGKSLTDYKIKHQELQLEISTTSQRIEYLASLKYLSPDQKKELDELKTKLSDAKTATSDLDKQFEDSSKRMLFNMLVTKAAADGLTTTEIDNLTKVAVSWGLVDQATATTAQQINAIDLSDGAFQLSMVDDILTHMNGLPRNYDYRITTIHTDKYFVERGGTESQEDSTSRGQERVGGERLAAGGTFSYVVPSGYNENYQVGPHQFAGSGETVETTVTPRGGGGESETVQLLRQILFAQKALPTYLRDALMQVSG